MEAANTQFHWPLPRLSDLAQLLRAFTGFKTKDVEEMGARCGKLFSSGQPLPVNKVFFRKLGRLSCEQVEAMKDPVLKKLISLKEAVENSMKELDTKDPDIGCSATGQYVN